MHIWQTRKQKWFWKTMKTRIKLTTTFLVSIILSNLHRFLLFYSSTLLPCASISISLRLSPSLTSCYCSCVYSFDIFLIPCLCVSNANSLSLICASLTTCPRRKSSCFLKPCISRCFFSVCMCVSLTPPPVDNLQEKTLE